MTYLYNLDGRSTLISVNYTRKIIYVHAHTQVPKCTVAEIVTVLCKLSVFMYTCVCVSVSVCARFDLWEHQHMFAICTAGARRIQFSQKKSIRLGKSCTTLEYKQP